MEERKVQIREELVTNVKSVFDELKSRNCEKDLKKLESLATLIKKDGQIAAVIIDEKDIGVYISNYKGKKLKFRQIALKYLIPKKAGACFQ